MKGIQAGVSFFQEESSFPLHWNSTMRLTRDMSHFRVICETAICM